MRATLESKLSDSFVEPKVAVEVKKYETKAYYVIVFGAVHRLTTDGHETVMDAVSKAEESGFIPAPGGEMVISVSRPASPTRKRESLDVRWDDVLHGDNATNYQILPGDRIFIKFVSSSGEGGGGFGGGAAGSGEAKPAKPGETPKKP